MYNVKKSRLITCFIIGLVSNILFWLSITCFDIVFLILSLAAFYHLFSPFATALNAPLSVEAPIMSIP